MRGLGYSSALRIVILALSLAAAGAVAQSAKPRVPPGADPGGVAVAYIGGGVQYTLAAIASRLARDGEGEIIGWDFIAGDRRPYPQCAQADTACGNGFRIPFTIIRQSAGRLVVARADISAPQTVVEAVKFVRRGPAKIVVLDAAAGANVKLLGEAAERYSELLFISAPPTDDGPLAAVVPRNWLIVSPDGWRRASELVVATDMLVEPAGQPLSSAYLEHAEAALGSIAALAGRLLTREPSLTAAALKERIIGLAKPLPPPKIGLSRHGWIERPDAEIAGR